MRNHWQTIALIVACFVGGCGEPDFSGLDGNFPANPNAMARGYWSISGPLPLPGMTLPSNPADRHSVEIFGMHRSDGEPDYKAIRAELLAGGIEAFGGEPEAFGGEPDCVGEMRGLDMYGRGCKLSYAKVYEKIPEGTSFALNCDTTAAAESATVAGSCTGFRAKLD